MTFTTMMAGFIPRYAIDWEWLRAVMPIVRQMVWCVCDLAFWFAVAYFLVLAGQWIKRKR